jgi:alpha-1,2-mannosyltransferase
MVDRRTPLSQAARVERGLDRLAAVAGLLLVLILGADAVYRAGPKERTDLPVYLAGSQRLLAGQDPLLASSKRGWPYVYPPTLAALLVPLSLLPQRLAAGLWFLLGVAAAIGGWWAWRRARRREGEPLWRWREDGLPLLLVALPATSALLRGQVGPLLLGLFLAAAACLHQRRDVLAGGLLALATAIKLTPGLLLVGLIVARRWKAAAGAAAGLLLWLVVVPLPFLGPSGTGEALEHFTQHMIVRPLKNPADPNLTSRNVHIANNQSLTSLTIRHLDGPPRKALLLLLALACLGVPLLLSALPAEPGPPSETAYALLIAAPLLVAPIAWHHHHVLAFPALALLATRRTRGANVALATFALLALLHFAVKPLRPWGLLGLGTLVVCLTTALRFKEERSMTSAAT